MTIRLISERAIAFVLYGDWVAECPMPYCENVEPLFDRVNPRVLTSPRLVPRPVFVCSNCALRIDIEWPEPQMIQSVMDVLNRRPVPQTRNWFPAELPYAVRLGVKKRDIGQSIDDLLAENAEYGVD